MKQEISELKNYLGNGLKFKTPLGIMEMTQIDLTTKKYPIWFGYSGDYRSKHFNAGILMKNGFKGKGYSLNKINPIVLPLSNLTQPITVEGYNEGKEFVPLVRLYNISKARNPDTKFEHEFIKGCGGNLILRTKSNKDYYEEFIYDRYCFHNRYENTKEKLGGINDNANQFFLHQKLFDWHFWIFDQSDFETGKVIDKSKI